MSFQHCRCRNASRGAGKQTQTVWKSSSSRNQNTYRALTPTKREFTFFFAHFTAYCEQHRTTNTDQAKAEGNRKCKAVLFKRKAHRVPVLKNKFTAPKRSNNRTLTLIFFFLTGCLFVVTSVKSYANTTIDNHLQNTNGVFFVCFNNKCKDSCSKHPQRTDPQKTNCFRTETNYYRSGGNPGEMFQTVTNVGEWTIKRWRTVEFNWNEIQWRTVCSVQWTLHLHRGGEG